MSSIKDERGYNQGFKPTKALDIRTERRCDFMISKMDGKTLGRETQILEIGCGIGTTSYLLAKKTNSTVIGTDLSENFIQEANTLYSLPNLIFQMVDFNKPETYGVNVSENKFDYIVGNGILHHLYYNLTSSLMAIHKLLKPKGKIIFCEPNIYNPYITAIFKIPILRKFAHLEPTEMAFSRRYIQKLLQELHYKNIDVQYKDFLLPNTPVFLIKSVITMGDIIEKIFPFNRLSQSIYISAEV